MVITPDKFTQTSVYDLMRAIAAGRIGFDHRVLHGILDRPVEQVVPDLVRYGTEDHPDAEFDLSDELVALFRHLKTPEAIPFFVYYLRRDPMEVSDDVIDALYPLRDAALEPLLQLYNELEEEQGGEVAFILASFRLRDARILKLLTDRLEYDAVDAAICLELYGDPASRPALESMLAQVPIDEVHVRRAIESGIAALDRPAEDERREPWSIWDDFPEQDLPAFDRLAESDLLEYLKCSDAGYRAAAAVQLADAELSDRAVGALFVRARTDEHPEVRGKCWAALSEPASERRDIRDAMFARLSDESAPLPERGGALVGLAREAGDVPIRAYVEQFLSVQQTRASALRAMWQSFDRTFGRLIPDFLGDPDPEVRKQAMTAIGYLGVYDAAERLRAFFEDEEYRPHALFAYALAMRAEVSRGRIRNLLRRIEEAAGGLTEEETGLVQTALDQRLMLEGHEPVFNREEREETEQQPASPPPGRNDPCPCGSGKKYKKCCGAPRH
jgi:hypothetical protein